MSLVLSSDTTGAKLPEGKVEKLSVYALSLMTSVTDAAMCLMSTCMHMTFRLPEYLNSATLSGCGYISQRL